MSEASVDISFAVNQVSVSETVDTFLNIQKRRESVVFLSTSVPANANLAHVESVDTNSDENLVVVDRADILEVNRIFIQKSEEILESINGFSIETDQFLITNKFTEDLATQTRIPLFYKHTLDVQLAGSEVYLQTKVLDSSFQEVPVVNYLVEDGVIYTNLFNQYDISTGLSTIHYVSYGIKSGASIQKYIEILSPLPVFVEADIDDIDLDTGLLLTTTQAYTLSEDISGTFNITVSQPGDYGVRRQVDSRIEVLAPLGVTSSDPWFVSVRNGKFLYGANKYYIAEFLTQSYQPFQPYKQIDETSFRVTERILKTTKQNLIYSEDDTLYPEVIVFKEDGTAKFALHSNPSKLGTAARSTGISYSSVQLGIPDMGGLNAGVAILPVAGSSFDLAGGFIVLPAGYEIDETDTISSYYTYEEKFYEFTAVDLNPVLNSEIVNQRLVLLLRPEPFGSTLDKTIYYVLVNEDGLVVESDIDFTLDGLPDTVDTMISSQSLFVDRDPDTVSWATSGIDLIQVSTLEGDSDLDGLLVLADVQVGNITSETVLVPLDIRVRGGGITTSLNDESVWYWDEGNWDGKPYPANAAIFIEIPYTLMDDFTASTIFGITERHIGNGIYPVVHVYNEYNPTITGIDIFGELTTFMWSQGPADARYAIFETITSVDDLQAIATNITTNEYTLSGYDVDTIVILGYPSGEDTAAFSSSIFNYRSVGV